MLDDACVFYGSLMSREDSIVLLDKMESYDWQRRKVGTSNLKRDTLVYGDTSLQGSIPKYWGDGVIVEPWTDELMDLKERVESLISQRYPDIVSNYNVALLNRYRKGSDTISWHSDREEMGDTKSISSISLGASRTFSFRRKGDNTSDIDIILETGSILFMGPGTQENYLHCLKKDDTSECRINVTFRRFDYR